MSEIHWADEYVNWLQGIVPELGDAAIYLRAATELPEWMQHEGLFAWFEPGGDLKIEKLLRSRSQWAGRGHLIVFSDAWFDRPEHVQRGGLLHEITHAICSVGQSVFDLPTSEFTIEHWLLTVPGGREKLMAMRGIPEPAATDHERESHGLRFVRCGLHLSKRVWQTVSPWELQLTGALYALQDDHFLAAIGALTPELAVGGDLFQILETEPPAAFSKLFD